MRDVVQKGQVAVRPDQLDPQSASDRVKIPEKIFGKGDLRRLSAAVLQDVLGGFRDGLPLQIKVIIGVQIDRGSDLGVIITDRTGFFRTPLFLRTSRKVISTFSPFRLSSSQRSIS